MQRESAGFQQLAIAMVAFPGKCVSKLVNWRLHLLRIVLAAVLAGGNSFAQQTPPAPSLGVQSSPTERSEKEPPQPPTEPRLFKVIPMENIATRQKEGPLSSREKLGLFFHGARDPFILVPPLLGTGFSEALLDNAGFGWGPAGFGKHYGAATAEEVSSHLFGTWVFPSLLHQDPRYYPKQSGGLASRMAYSVSRVAITRADNGTRQINYSRLAAALASSAISNSYYPEGHRGISHTATTALVSLGVSAGFNLVREFLHDINRLTAKGHWKAATGGPSGSEQQ